MASCFFCSSQLMGLLNVVTGFFVQSACAIVERDRASIIDTVVEDLDNFRSGMTHIFHRIDADNVGYLDLNKLETNLDDEAIRLMFALHGLSCRNALQLFTLLDEQGTGKIGLDAFLDGCERLKGFSKSIDLLSLQSEIHGITSFLSLLTGGNTSRSQYLPDRSSAGL